MPKTDHPDTRIAYNQHRAAPQNSARARREGETFLELARQSRNAAKRTRRARSGK